MEEESQRAPWFLRAILLASLLLLALSVGAEYLSQPKFTERVEIGRGPHDMAIVPGTRADFVTIGLPYKEVQAGLGPGVVRPVKASELIIFEEYGLSVSIVDDRVEHIYLVSPEFKTRAGVGVGSDVDEVVKSQGRDYEFEGETSDYVMHYWEAGIHYTIKDEKVTAIQLSAPILGK